MENLQIKIVITDGEKELRHQSILRLSNDERIHGVSLIDG